MRMCSVRRSVSGKARKHCSLEDSRIHMIHTHIPRGGEAFIYVHPLSHSLARTLILTRKYMKFSIRIQNKCTICQYEFLKIRWKLILWFIYVMLLWLFSIPLSLISPLTKKTNILSSILLKLVIWYTPCRKSFFHFCSVSHLFCLMKWFTHT